MVQVTGAPELLLQFQLTANVVVVEPHILIPQLLALVAACPRPPLTDTQQIMPLDHFLQSELQAYRVLLEKVSLSALSCSLPGLHLVCNWLFVGLVWQKLLRLDITHELGTIDLYHFMLFTGHGWGSRGQWKAKPVTFFAQFIVDGDRVWYGVLTSFSSLLHRPK